MTRTEYHRLTRRRSAGPAEIAVHGHWGRPVIWFPSEGGAPWDFEANGMLDAVRPAIDDGRITVFCVPSFDSLRWSASWMPLDRPGPQPPPLRGLDHLAGGAVHPRPVRRAGRRRAGRAVDGRVPRGAVRAAAPARVRPRGGAVRQLRPVGLARLGPDRRRDLLRQPVRSSCPAPTAGTWTTCAPGWRSRWWWAAGCGRTAPARTAPPARWPGCWRTSSIPHELYVWGHEWPHDWPSWRAQAAIYLPALG